MAGGRLAARLESAADGGAHRESATDGGAQLEHVVVDLDDATLIVLEAGGRRIVALTAPDPALGLALFDLRTCLADAFPDEQYCRGACLMRLRTVTLAGVAVVATAAAVATRRRRRPSPPAPAVQLGLTDGSTVRLAAGDPGVADLRARASEVRAALEAVR